MGCRFACVVAPPGCWGGLGCRFACAVALWPLVQICLPSCAPWGVWVAWGADLHGQLRSGRCCRFACTVVLPGVLGWHGVQICFHICAPWVVRVAWGAGLPAQLRSLGCWGGVGCRFAYCTVVLPKVLGWLGLPIFACTGNAPGVLGLLEVHTCSHSCAP